MREINVDSYCCEHNSTPGPGKFMGRNQEVIDKIEKEKVEPFWSYYKEYNPERLLRQFMDTDDEKKVWDLIPAVQYQNLLNRYMENPIAARIPDNVVTSWVELICKNLAQVISIEKLFGRTTRFPYRAVVKVFERPLDVKRRLRSAMCLLSGTGFYKWAETQEGRPSWNDWGFPQVYKILKEYRDGMDPGDKLILINRCIDVVHGRGPMAEYFLEGGIEACNRISNS